MFFEYYSKFQSGVVLKGILVSVVVMLQPSLASADVTRQEVLDWLGSQDAPTLQPGSDLVTDQLEAAITAYLPPGLAEELIFSGAQLSVRATGDYPPHEAYRRATLQYGPQTALGPDGELQNYVAGLPFSVERIEAAAPERGGTMVAWNNVYRWQYFGYRSHDILMNFVSAGNDEAGHQISGFGLAGGGVLERVLHNNYQRVYLDHIATLPHKDFQLSNADADGLFYKDLMEFTDPFDVRGMKFVIERADAPHVDDQVYSYLPTQRRVRRVSAKERADSFMGTNMTMDDFEGFSGRVLDYRWMYHGRKEILTIPDSSHPTARYYGPHSRAPDDEWQLRTCLVIEQIPTWEGHPYHSKILFVDAQTFNIPLAMAFDRETVLWKLFFTLYDWYGDQGDEPQYTVPVWLSMNTVDFKKNNATVVISQETTLPALEPEDVRRLFSVSNLTGGR